VHIWSYHPQGRSWPSIPAPGLASASPSAYSCWWRWTQKSCRTRSLRPQLP
jgi:hypothetical protein